MCQKCNVIFFAVHTQHLLKKTLLNQGEKKKGKGAREEGKQNLRKKGEDHCLFMCFDIEGE